MRFPLDKEELTRGCLAHKMSGLGCGADYVARYVNLYAPFDGRITRRWYGSMGGNWLEITDDKGNRIQFAHLSKYILPLGDVKEGQVMAITGNTGWLTTGAHLHVQILRPDGSRIDPVGYFDNQLTQGQIMFDRALGYNRDIYKGILGEGGRTPTVLRLKVGGERALLRKFDDGSVKIRRNVSLEEFSMVGAGEPVPVKESDVKGIPTF